MKPFFNLLILLAVASFCADIAYKVVVLKASVCISAMEEDEPLDADESENTNQSGQDDVDLKMREFEFVSSSLQYSPIKKYPGLKKSFRFLFHRGLSQYAASELFSPPEMV